MNFPWFSSVHSCVLVWEALFFQWLNKSEFVCASMIRNNKKTSWARDAWYIAVMWFSILADIIVIIISTDDYISSFTSIHTHKHVEWWLRFLCTHDVDERCIKKKTRWGEKINKSWWWDEGCGEWADCEGLTENPSLLTSKKSPPLNIHRK